MEYIKPNFKTRFKTNICDMQVFEEFTPKWRVETPFTRKELEVYTTLTEFAHHFVYEECLTDLEVMDLI